MKYHAPINIENLSIIQEKVLAKSPKSMMHLQGILTLPNDVEEFLSIPELKTELDKLGWTKHLYAVNYCITLGNRSGMLHSDGGTGNYSFNLPILNCANTFVNFYTTNIKPIASEYKRIYIPVPGDVNSKSEIGTFNKYNIEDCTLVESLEMVTPHIINIRQIHKVVNPTDLPRISLLIRLKNELNQSLDPLFD